MALVESQSYVRLIQDRQACRKLSFREDHERNDHERNDTKNYFSAICLGNFLQAQEKYDVGIKLSKFQSSNKVKFR